MDSEGTHEDPSIQRDITQKPDKEVFSRASSWKVLMVQRIKELHDKQTEAADVRMKCHGAGSAAPRKR